MRAGTLVAAAVSSLPLWRRVDPLTILALSAGDREERERSILDAEEDEDRTSKIGSVLEGDSKDRSDRKPTEVDAGPGRDTVTRSRRV